MNERRSANLPCTITYVNLALGVFFAAVPLHKLVPIKDQSGVIVYYIYCQLILWKDFLTSLLSVSHSSKPIVSYTEDVNL